MSSISSLNSPASGLSFNGLSSGLDTTSIVNAMLAVQQAQVTNLQNQQKSITTDQAAFDSLQAQLVGLQTKAQQLGRAVNGAFDGRAVQVSDTSVVDAAAGSFATPGIYSFQVSGLAQAEQLASQGMSDPNAALQTGTLQIQVGSGAVTSITVDGSNNTLQGLANAINNASGDVIASVVNDGSSTPYRLLLTSKVTGLANQIQVTNNLNQGTGVSLNPAAQTVRQAADATIVLGSGAGQLPVHSASNTVTSLIKGVTLNLKNANPNETVTLTVSPDVAAATQAIQDFVTSYNNVIDFINQRSTYDPATNTAGVFLGSQDAAGVEAAVARTVGGAVAGLPSQANQIGAIGITFDSNGHLVIDSGKLNQALTGQLSGVSPADVRNLFALTGSSTNPGVAFQLAGSNTRATGPVGVKITQAATQAVLTGTSAAQTSVTLDGTNNQVSLSLNGRSATVQLAQGVYNTAAQFAQALQTAINGSSSLTGSQVNVSADASGILSITTGNYGTGANVTLTGGSALATLGLSSGQTASGRNVAGQFLVNGVPEQAVGSGQTLVGLSGNANTDGLQVQVTLTQSQLDPSPNNPEAQVTLARGVGTQLDSLLNSYVDPVNGRFKSLDDGFQQSVSDLQKSIDRQNALIQQQHDTLVQEFADMEATISQLRSVGNSLSGLLSSLGSSGGSTSSSSIGSFGGSNLSSSSGGSGS